MGRSDMLSNLEKAMQLPQGSLTGREVLENLPEWDSFAVLTFIALVQQQTGIVIDSHKLSRARTVNDLILPLLSANGSAATQH
jgi:acyl carrier protein